MALTQVKTNAIADDAVTQDKVANDAIDISEIKSGTDGELITYDASGNPAKVAAGTSGHFLKSQGAGSVPVFAAVPAGGIADVVSDTSPQLGGDLDTNSFEINLDDGHKVKFGELSGGDLTVYHNGTNTGVIDNITGNLNINCLDGNFVSYVGDEFQVYVNDTEYAIRAIGNGAVKLYHDGTEQCSTSANGLAFPNGKGIDFSAHGNDSGATGQSTDSEVLDEYEEGEWEITPNNSNLTFTNPDCRYTKIGNLVTCVGKIDVNTVTGSDLTYLELPFSCAHVANYGNASASAMIHTNIDAGGDTCGLFIPGNTANAWMFGSQNDGGWRHISNSHLSSSSEMVFTFSYRTT